MTSIGGMLLIRSGLRSPLHIARPLLQQCKPVICISSLRGNSHFKFHATYTTKAIVGDTPEETHKNKVDLFTKASLDNTSPQISAPSSTTSEETVIPVTPSICTTPPISDTAVHAPERVKDLRGLINAYQLVGSFALIVVTTMAGFVLAPLPFNLPTFIASTVGTTLACSSANTFNQIYEVAHDAKMARTRRRILPTGKLSLTHAVLFGSVTGLSGSLILLYGVNAFAASLAFANIVLYAGVYTPLKRVHPINTWVGSIVGAVPPVIGWVSVTNSMDLGAWVLGALLFIWQIPHFLALSWGYKIDYANAGYKMVSNVYPEKLPTISLRYWALSWWSGMTTGFFAVDSLLIDAYLLWFGYQFYRDNSVVKARKFFFATLIFLPAFLGLMIFHSTKFRGRKQLEEADNKT